MGAVGQPEAWALAGGVESVLDLGEDRCDAQDRDRSMQSLVASAVAFVGSAGGHGCGLGHRQRTTARRGRRPGSRRCWPERT
jgi:hypothetical protein